MIKDEAADIKATNRELLDQVEQQAAEAGKLLEDGNTAQQVGCTTSLLPTYIDVCQPAI